MDLAKMQINDILEYLPKNIARIMYKLSKNDMGPKIDIKDNTIDDHVLSPEQLRAIAYTFEMYNNNDLGIPKL